MEAMVVGTESYSVYLTLDWNLNSRRGKVHVKLSWSCWGHFLYPRNKLRFLWIFVKFWLVCSVFSLQSSMFNLFLIFSGRTFLNNVRVDDQKIRWRWQNCLDSWISWLLSRPDSFYLSIYYIGNIILNITVHFFGYNKGHKDRSVLIW